jgi:hypothetical protein
VKTCRCPHCGDPIHFNAGKCGDCRRELEDGWIPNVTNSYPGRVMRFWPSRIPLSPSAWQENAIRILEGD